MKFVDLTMTRTEKKPRTLEIKDLQTGETVSSAVATHTPPSGSALTITPSVSTNFVNFLLGPFAVAGTHFVKVQATGSLGSKPEVIYMIRVVSG